MDRSDELVPGGGPLENLGTFNINGAVTRMFSCSGAVGRLLDQGTIVRGGPVDSVAQIAIASTGVITSAADETVGLFAGLFRFAAPARLEGVTATAAGAVLCFSILLVFLLTPERGEVR